MPEFADLRERVINAPIMVRAPHLRREIARALKRAERMEVAVRDADRTFEAGYRAADADGYWPGAEWSAFMLAMDALRAAVREGGDA